MLNLRKGSIRKLQATKEALRETYEINIAEIDRQIDEIRKARGTKLKKPSGERHFEEGRDRPRDWSMNLGRSDRIGRFTRNPNH